MPGKLLTPVEEMIQEDLLEEPIFTVSFVKAIGSEEGAQGGKLILGGLDVERMLGGVTWVASTSTVFWGFSFEKGDIRYGRQDIWPEEAPTRLSELLLIFLLPPLAERDTTDRIEIF